MEESGNYPYLITLGHSRLMMAPHNKRGGVIEKLDLFTRQVLSLLIACGVKADDQLTGFFVKIETLCERSGKSKATIDRAIASLTKAGLVERVQARRTPDRPSVACTNITPLAAELLFAGSDSNLSHSTSASKMRHKNSEALKVNVDTTESPTRVRAHAYTRGGDQKIQKPKTHRAEEGTQTAAQPLSDGQSSSTKRLPATLRFLVNSHGWTHSQVCQIMSFSKSAGISKFQDEVWPHYSTEILGADDQYAYCRKILNLPNLKEILAAKNGKLQEAKNEKIEKKKAEVNQNRISEFSGRTFDFIKSPDFQIQISGPTSIFKVKKSTGDRRPISQSNFFELLDNNELQEYKSHNQKFKLMAAK